MIDLIDEIQQIFSKHSMSGADVTKFMAILKDVCMAYDGYKGGYPESSCEGCAVFVFCERGGYAEWEDYSGWVGEMDKAGI